MRLRLALATLAALVAAAPAAADPADLRGLGAESQARANPVALGGGIAAAVTGNPALLAGRAATTTLDLGAGWDAARVTLAPRPAGADVSREIYGARLPDGSPIPHNLATADLPLARRDREPGGGDLSLAFSGAAPVLDGRLGLGWAVLVPLGGAAQSTSYADEREAAFGNRVRLSLLDDDLGSTVIAVGLGGRAGARLALGVGALVLIGAQPASRAYLPDPLAGERTEINMETSVLPDVVPLVGAAAHLGRGVSLAASLRLAHGLETNGSTTIQLWGDGSEGETVTVQPIHFVVDYQPLRLAAGAAIARPGWDASLEAVYGRWSAYRDHHGEAPAPGFADTLELGASGRLRAAGVDLLAGARFVPSPVPPQTGRSNFADADRLLFGLGARRELRPGVELALGVALAALRRRTVWKDPAAATAVVDEFPDAIGLDGAPLATSAGLQTNNPGWPGYTVSGALLAGSLSLTVRR